VPDLAIVGYGKMGRLIEQLASEYGFRVAARLDRDWSSLPHKVDVAVEFSEPEAVVRNLERLATQGVPIVVGTTGWFQQLDTARELVERNRIGLVWSSNFSIGMNVFGRIVAQAANLLKDEEQYGAWGWEIHHATKKDAPSGSMLKLVEAMKQSGYKRPVQVASNRAGAHPGTHEIGFDSAADTITLRHTARSREGFARGALKAAQWIIGRKGFYEFSEVLFGG
jgi:4-hydroxy-tetrahydrodipicolinate reductase